MEDLITLFEALDLPSQADDVEIFTTVNLPGTTHRIGKDANGGPVLLVSSTSNEKGPQIHLEHLDVQRVVHCKVTSSRKMEEGVFTVIRCTEADKELARYFLRSVEPVLRSLGPTPTSAEVVRAITHLVELFRALAQPAMKSVRGLWAELFVICNARNPLELFQSWHASSEEKYDFNAGLQRIEVKSTSQKERIHHFSLEQLNPPAGAEVVVASLFVSRSGGGLSLNDLIDQVRNQVPSNYELQERLDKIIAQTLGSSFRMSLTERFDKELALDSLRIFRASEVPTIPLDVPWGISDIHFKSDLSRATSLTKDELVGMGGIYAAMIR